MEEDDVAEDYEDVYGEPECAFDSREDVGAACRIVEAGDSTKLAEFLAARGFTGEECLDDYPGAPSDFCGATMLHHACYCPDRAKAAELARTMLDRGCPVDVKDGEGATPLMYAFARGNPSLVDLLLERGADPTVRRETDGLGVMDVLATEDGADGAACYRIVKSLARRRDGFFAGQAGDGYLLDAVGRGWEGAVRGLIELGVAPSPHVVRMARRMVRAHGDQAAMEILEAVANPSRVKAVGMRPAAEKEI